MRTNVLAIVMTITVVFVWNRILATRDVVATGSTVGAIHIEQNWKTWQGDGQYAVRGVSQGTAISAHTILTHNHFQHPAESTGEILTILDADGWAMVLAMTDVIFEPIDEGTLLIHLPGNVTLSPAPLANSQVVEGLGLGVWLTVSYWADDLGQFVQEDFEIVKLEAGVATLLDAHQHINPGDSGSGTYFEGQLVGNVWSIYTTQSGAPLGKFSVALLPTQVAAIADGEDQSSGWVTFTPSSDVELEAGQVIAQ